MSRVYDVDTVQSAVSQYKEDIYGFVPEDWLEDRRNVALTNTLGDVALFERELPHVVTGHYFFQSRGKGAITSAKELLEEIFTGPYDVEVIRGLTPITNLGARWMSKKIKFKSYGVVDTQAGPCELFILTKPEWEEIYG